MTELNTIRTSYKDYRKNTENPVNLDTYVDIANGFMEYLMDKIFEGKQIQLPSKLGTLGIKGKERKLRTNENGTPLLPVDWGETNKLWRTCSECKKKKQLIYHLNEHSDGVAYKFYWQRGSYNKNIKLYNLHMTRTNKRKLAKLIKEGKEYQMY